MPRTAQEQLDIEAAARVNPPAPPLDAASVAVIEKACTATGRKSTKDELVKQIEALPLEKRADALMGLAMASGKSFP